MEFRVILAADCFVLDEATGQYVDLRETQAGLELLYNKGMRLKVSGIIKPNEEAVAGMLTGAIAYTADLTEHVIRRAGESEAVRTQMADPTTDIFNGLIFRETTGDLTDAQKAAEFSAYVNTLSESEKAQIYVEMMSIPTDEQLDTLIDQSIGDLTRADIEKMMQQGLTQQVSINAEEFAGYISAMSDEELMAMVRQMAVEKIREGYAMQMAGMYSGMNEDMRVRMLGMELFAIVNGREARGAQYYDELMSFSESSYERNLLKLGYVDLDRPASINLYAATFEAKDTITAAIASYNESVPELEQIAYTDYVGLMMSSITTIIDAITYVLIAFVSISLVVSSIMIGVITLISVQERTKEIGILRAIGASKRNVSSMFSAETLIIGFTSGLLGVVVTVLLCIPINAIIQGLTGLMSLSAYLPWQVGLILIGISMLLTLFAGIIPSRSAARKDPVVALRSE